MSISLGHILFGVLGFLLGSAGAGGAVYGAKKRSPLSMILGLLFCLSGIAVFFSALLFKDAMEEALADAVGDEDDDDDEVEIKADVEKPEDGEAEVDAPADEAEEEDASKKESDE